MLLPYIFEMFTPGSPKERIGPLTKIIFWAIILLFASIFVKGILGGIMGIVSFAFILTIIVWTILWYPIARSKVK